MHEVVPSAVMGAYAVAVVDEEGVDGVEGGIVEAVGHAVPVAIAA